MRINPFSYSPLPSRTSAGTAPTGQDFDALMAREPAGDAGIARDYTQLADAFTTWKAARKSALAPADFADLERHAEGFLALMKRAGEQNGYADPQAFLQTLSRADLAHLQVVHGLAAPIAPQDIGKEGALNLLLPPPEMRDLDNDGFKMEGVGRRWVFPPDNAPEQVKQAWAKATQGFDSEQMLMAQACFFPPVRVADDGVHLIHAAYLAPDADYLKLVTERIDSANYARRFTPPEQIAYLESRIAFMTDLRNQLNQG